VKFFERAENIFAGILIVSFFLPWGQVFGFGLSGHGLTKMGSYGTLAWLIPLFSTLVIIIGLNEGDQKLLGMATGSLPWIGLVYGLAKAGDDLFHVLAIGAYLTLLSATGLILSAAGMITVPANASQSRRDSESHHDSRPRRLVVGEEEGRSSRSDVSNESAAVFTYKCAACGSFQKSDDVACLNCETANPHRLPSLVNVPFQESESKEMQINDTGPQKVFCNQCGKRLAAGDNFCPCCGVRAA